MTVKRKERHRANGPLLVSVSLDNDAHTICSDVPGKSSPPVDVDAKLIANGYEPVPAVGKRPNIPGWSSGEMTVERIRALRSAHPDHTNTGLRTGRVAAIDVDLHTPDHAAEIINQASLELGFAPQRIGSKGAMLVYRNHTPIPKILISGRHPTMKDDKGKPLLERVEILGQGQQFIAYGRHPDTGKAYRWDDAEELGEPSTRPRANLPAVTPGLLREFAATAAGILTKLGYTDVRISDRGTHAAAREAKRREDKVPVDREVLIEILGYLDPGCDRVEWISRIGSIQATPLRDVAEKDMDGELIKIAQAWSHGDYWPAGCPGDCWAGDEDVEDTYNTLTPDRIGGSTFGSLWRAAKGNGYTKSAPRSTMGEEFPEFKAGLNGAKLPNSEDRAAAWGEPADIFDGASIVRAPVFSADMVPDVIARFAFDKAALLGTEPGIMAALTLPVCAAAIHDGIRVQHGALNTDWVERAHANVLVCQDIGWTKTATLNTAASPLEKLENELGAGYRAAYANYKTMQKLSEGLQESDDPIEAPPKPEPAPQILIEDNTTEAVLTVQRDTTRGLLSKQDEYAGFVGSFDCYRHGRTGKDQSFWNKTDDGGSYHRHRAVGGDLSVENCGVCHMGMIQPERLREIVRNLPNDGFIQRAFVITPFAEVPPEKIERAPDMAAMMEYERTVRGLYDLSEARATLVLSPEALTWQKEVETLATSLIRLPMFSAAFKAHLLKVPGRFSRLALTFHAIDCVSRGEGLAPVIPGRIGKMVRDFMLRYLLPHAARFYAEFYRDVDEVDRDVRWIAGHILARPDDKRDSITARDIERASDGGRIVDEVSPAMERLVTAGWLSAAKVERDGPKQRSIRWRINPKIYAAFAERAAEEATRRAEARAAMVVAMRNAEGWRLS